MIIPKRSYCNSCGEQIQGEHWKTKCDDCFKSDHAVTTPFAESKHPALVYEREHPIVEPKPANPEHVQACLKELMAMVDVTVETPEKAVETRSWECEHTFIGKHRICDDCGIFEVQWQDSIDFEVELIRGSL